MYRFPILIVNRYKQLFDIDPLSILDKDLLQIVPATISTRWTFAEILLDDILHTMTHEEYLEYKLDWFWNQMSPVDRDQLVHRLFAT